MSDPATVTRRALPDASANGDFFDVLTLHIYFRADTVYTITHEMRDLLESRWRGHVFAS